jgi:alpha-tubulin suppressor-like RCC1 family protein
MKKVYLLLTIIIAAILSSTAQSNTIDNPTIEIAAGYYHNLALKEDGTLWAWGSNYDGQLGDGTFTNRSSPVQVLNLSNVKTLAAGHSHSLALKEDGSVWAWGVNYSGCLGDGTSKRKRHPSLIS